MLTRMMQLSSLMQHIKHLSQMTLQEVSLQLKVLELVQLNFVLYQRQQVSQVLVVVTQSFLRNLKETARTFTSYGTEEKLLSLMVFHGLYSVLQQQFFLKKVRKNLRKTLATIRKMQRLSLQQWMNWAFTTQVARTLLTFG